MNWFSHWDEELESLENKAQVNNPEDSILSSGRIAITEEVNELFKEEDVSKNKNFIPETLQWCREHYVPPVDKYITCSEFGHTDGMNGNCWWCMEMTPYQWHMCKDDFWVRCLLKPEACKHMQNREDAIRFIEKYKQEHPLGNEQRVLISNEVLDEMRKGLSVKKNG